MVSISCRQYLCEAYICSTMSIDFFAVLQIFSFRESGENQIEKADDVLQKVEQILDDFYL